MKREMMIKACEALYREDPTTQPTAFWKFVQWCEDPELKVEMSGDSVAMHHHNEIIYDFPQDLESPWRGSRYFKLYHNHEGIAPVSLPKGFGFREVEVDDYQEVAQFIVESYDNIRVDAAQVKSWTKRAVYDAGLWLWLIDAATGEKAGLGIAELDTTMREGALEWVQVRATHRGQGLGKQLVSELLKRISARADFTTVSGDVDNPSNPEALYRACGFKGERIWYVYQKQK